MKTVSAYLFNVSLLVIFFFLMEIRALHMQEHSMRDIFTSEYF